jgi:hypothetical protein
MNTITNKDLRYGDTITVTGKITNIPNHRDYYWGGQVEGSSLGYEVNAIYITNIQENPIILKHRIFRLYDHVIGVGSPLSNFNNSVGIIVENNDSNSTVVVYYPLQNTKNKCSVCANSSYYDHYCRGCLSAYLRTYNVNQLKVPSEEEITEFRSNLEFLNLAKKIPKDKITEKIAALQALLD